MVITYDVFLSCILSSLISFLFCLCIPATICDWARTAESKRRQQFCDKYEGYFSLCHCKCDVCYGYCQNPCGTSPQSYTWGGGVSTASTLATHLVCCYGLLFMPVESEQLLLTVTITSRVTLSVTSVALADCHLGASVPYSSPISFRLDLVNRCSPLARLPSSHYLVSGWQVGSEHVTKPTKWSLELCPFLPCFELLASCR